MLFLPQAMIGRIGPMFSLLVSIKKFGTIKIDFWDVVESRAKAYICKDLIPKKEVINNLTSREISWDPSLCRSMLLQFVEYTFEELLTNNGRLEKSAVVFSGKDLDVIFAILIY